MPRSGSYFIALCMVAIAGSASVLAFTVGAVGAGSAAAVGLALLLAMVIGHIAGQIGADRTAAEARFADLTRASGEATRNLVELTERVERFEALALDRSRSASDPLAAEVDELGAIVKQFAETLQLHEEAILQSAGFAPETVPAAPAAVAAPPPAPVMREAPPSPPVQVLQRQAAQLRRQSEARQPPVDLPQVFAGLGRSDAIAVIDEAISAKRYELFLQPIVTLPQRKVRSYQASVRIRTADGQVLLPEDYRSLADDAGLMPGLDAEVLGRCVQIVRRLTARNRDVGLVCDLSGSSLADAAFASELIASLEASRTIAGSLVLGFTQATVRAMSALDVETLRSLSDKGFRFAMDGVRDLRIEPRDIADKGIRLVKVPASLMIARSSETGAAIHVADLSGLFLRYGIDLVVEDVETEAVVVDLLDYEVRFAQGALFSQPRPVRAEVMATAEPASPPVPAAAPAARVRADQRPEPRPEARPQTLGAAVLAQGAVSRESRRPAGGSGLRALIRDRS
ncbi:MAG: EAL domain-containing protein [Phreatobacter sp.]|uniref:EAL domain-containing protein n=1 Tax=Phreatobacter sp. TaxID=1966341 RepID=UPI002734F2A2|nr:EAL domain-containing protein [Phreatobacter sp.]MDP2803861.1 EAL domain-containing protein [Phreatobacter sp.]